MQARASGILLPRVLPAGALRHRHSGRSRPAVCHFLADAGQKFWQILPLVPPGGGDSPYMSAPLLRGQPPCCWTRRPWPTRACSPMRALLRPVGRPGPGGLPLAAQKPGRPVPLGLGAGQGAVCRGSGPVSGRGTGLAARLRPVPGPAERFGGAELAKWPDEIRLRRAGGPGKGPAGAGGRVPVPRLPSAALLPPVDGGEGLCQRKGRLHHWRHAPSTSPPTPPRCGPSRSSSSWTGPWPRPRWPGSPRTHSPTRASTGATPSTTGPGTKRPALPGGRRRGAQMARLYDVVRIDHFRPFHTYWAIPAGAADARAGHWEQGPGRDLLDALKGVPGLALIAEDLGGPGRRSPGLHRQKRPAGDEGAGVRLRPRR